MHRFTAHRCAGIFALVLLSASPLPAPAQDAAQNAPAAARVPLIEGTGTHTRKITTDDPEAQKYFDQGLNLLYAFNHDESIKSFQEAAALDPHCAMAYWGIALACGPHINFPVVLPDRAKMAVEALKKAQENQDNCTPAEKGMIAALTKRYADPQPEDRRPLDEAYANALRDLYRQFPDDNDIGVMFAEALMDLRPWDLWTHDGKPQPETPEIVATLRRVMASDPAHPMALHLFIHAMEASPHPEAAMDAANRLRGALPGLGHMVHMPSHIDVLTGQWQKAIDANTRAIAVDRAYTAKNRKVGFYRVYKAHNQHMLAFASSMVGESNRALQSMQDLAAEMPDDWKKENAPFADGFIGMRYEVMMRFGRWQDILKQPEPPALFPITRALRFAARTAAFNALGKQQAAALSYRSFQDTVARIPKDAQFGNNPASLLFRITDRLLVGEIRIKAGKTKEGIQALREAVAAEDQCRYDEPPDWFYPTRHALGAALLNAHRPAEAEKVYREDLKRFPDNGWSLFGLSQSLAAQKKMAEATTVRRRFDTVWKNADLRLTTSCLCLGGKS